MSIDKGRMSSIRESTWKIVNASTGDDDSASRIFDKAILGLIFLNVIAVIIGTMQSVHERIGTFLYVFEVISVSIFTAEYIARLWSCTADKGFKGSISGRISFALRAMSIIDLLAILPFYLPFFGADLRSLRVLRILRVAKIGRYCKSVELLQRVLVARKEELVLTTGMMGLLLVVSSTLLYYCENAVQPEVFSSIPATMWWSIATLTTVGYGDLYPITIFGKICASIIAVLGIGMFALPTGILGAGFVSAFEEDKSGKETEEAKSGEETCRHCGR